MEDGLRALRAAVDALYEYKERCFGEAKQGQLESHMRAASAAHGALALGEAGVPLSTKAEAALLCGRALDAGPAFSAEAEECLSRAVRLDPASAMAWAALGHCLWKKSDLPGAQECFTTSVARQPSPFALRSLSQLVRMAALRGGGGDARRAAHEASIEHAKAAVALAMGDAQSWAVLGVAHLYHAIHVTGEEEELRKAGRAFAMGAKVEAEALGGSREAAPAAAARPGLVGLSSCRSSRDPDLHFNRGVLLAYLNDYAAAVASFSTAQAVDATLPCQVRATFTCLPPPLPLFSLLLLLTFCLPTRPPPRGRRAWAAFAATCSACATWCTERAVLPPASWQICAQPSRPRHCLQRRARAWAARARQPSLRSSALASMRASTSACA